MKNILLPLALVASLVAPAALSHSGVKDPQVMARMNVMSLISNDMKVLGGIAKGSAAFDLDRIAARAALLAEHSDEVLVRFKAPAADPKSEARPSIWDDWADFQRKTEDMKDAADKLGQVTSVAEFQDAFQALGKTCTACHEVYRIKNN